MTQIDNISDQPLQTLNVTLDDGTPVIVTLRFLPSVQRWFLDFSYGAIGFVGLCLCLHPNILRAWRGRIPFGLLVKADDGADPFSQNDFSTARVGLYVLTAAEVADVESQIMAAA